LFAIEYLELETLAEIEDAFECSGMCEPGLFYFSRPISEGMPHETCMHKMVVYLQDNTHGFGSMATINGILALMCFIAHFALYGKQPKKESKQPAHQENQQEIQMEPVQQVAYQATGGNNMEDSVEVDQYEADKSAQDKQHIDF